MEYARDGEENMGYAWLFQAFSGAFGGIEVDREALRGGFWGLLGAWRWLRRCSITIFVDFLDFSIVLFLLGSWFFRNIAGEYFWTFLTVRFR